MRLFLLVLASLVLGCMAPPQPSGTYVFLPPDWREIVRALMTADPLPPLPPPPPPPPPCMRTPSQMNDLEMAFQAGLVADLDLIPSYVFENSIGGYPTRKITLTNNTAMGIEIERIITGELRPPPGCPSSEGDFTVVHYAGGDIEVTGIELLPGMTPITLPAIIGPTESWQIRVLIQPYNIPEGRLHVDDSANVTLAFARLKITFP